MPLPQDPRATQAYLLRWTAGNAAAADCLALVCDLARLADDAADRPGPAGQKAIAKALSIALVDLPQNPFWTAHAHRLSLVMSEALVMWEWSDELKGSADERRQTFGFVLREATDRIAVAIARIVGGHDFAAIVAREIYEVCHAPSVETVAEWARGS